MTFDAQTYLVQPLICEADNPLSEGRDDYSDNDLKAAPARQKDIKDDFCKDRQIADWEDEGGAYADRTDGVFRDSRVNSVSYLAAHIDAAEALMDIGHYDAAYAELEAAADRFMTYKEKISRSFDHSINILSTLGCRATPPHPKALSLVRLRQNLTT